MIMLSGDEGNVIQLRYRLRAVLLFTVDFKMRTVLYGHGKATEAELNILIL